MSGSKEQDDIEQFDANEERYKLMDEEIELAICPICLQVSPGALECGCFADIMSGGKD